MLGIVISKCLIRQARYMTLELRYHIGEMENKQWKKIPSFY